jgi:hypothetical protein
LPTFSHYELIDACREPGCAVCRLEQKAVVRYLDSQFYENVNNPDFREHLRASLGFCREHAWLTINQHLGDALGFAIIYRDVVDEVLRRLQKNTQPLTTRQWAVVRNRVLEQVGELVRKVAHAIKPRKRCPACLQQEEAVHNLISTLAEGLAQPEMLNALRASEGLCLGHLVLTLQEMKDISLTGTLLELHIDKLKGLRGELEELIRKSDYRYAKEGFGKEGDAWRRAVVKMVGNNRSRD